MRLKRQSAAAIAESDARVDGSVVDIALLVGLIEILVAERDTAMQRAQAAERMAASYAGELAARRAREAEMVDGTSLVRQLGELAGVELPRVVDEATRLMHDKAELHTRARRAEQLVEAFIPDDLAELQTDHDED